MPDDAFSALAGGIVGAFFAFAGWWEVTRISGEIENPQKNLPKALTIGVVVITLIYILTSAVFLYLVPVSQVTNDETFAAQAGVALCCSGGIVSNNNSLSCASNAWAASWPDKGSDAAT